MHDVAVVKSLGTSAPAAAPSAVRVARPGWRDPRLWIGIAIVAACVVAGARLFASADDTVEVWSVRSDTPIGSRVSDADLEVQHVRFSDLGALDRYFQADEELPEEMVLTRAIGEGELLPRAAVGSAKDADVVQVPLLLDAGRVPPSVTAGSRVNVWMSGAKQPLGNPVLEDVEVISKGSSADALSSDGQVQLTLAVEPSDEQAFFTLSAGEDEPTFTVVATNGK